jgi:hypothetical protein
MYAAAMTTYGTVQFYISTDHGANWSATGAIKSFSQAVTSPYLFVDRGYAGYLWFSAQFTGGSPAGIWRSTDRGANWTRLTTYPPNGLVYAFCLGAPREPGNQGTLYMLGRQTYGAPLYLYYSTNSGKSWNILGDTGGQKDLPESCQIAGIQSIQGDWDVFNRIYACSQQMGFAYYTP